VLVWTVLNEAIRPILTPLALPLIVATVLYNAVLAILVVRGVALGLQSYGLMVRSFRWNRRKLALIRFARTAVARG
jgi:uncharacterized membrane protein YvlD (DUF360 family)